MAMKSKYSQKICWLWLVMSLGAGNPKLWELLNEYTTVEETCRFVQTNSSIRKNVVEVKSAKELLVDCLKQGIGVVCYSDEEYPNALKDVHNPPAVLFYRGDFSLLSCERLLTIVGTRNPSEYTVKVTQHICSELVKEGYVLISGCAVGVDSMVHQSCIDNNQKTISILANGIDYDYPKENRTLKQKILQLGGLILTEQLPNTAPYRTNFPKRNRILASLGKGTLITEASLGSGALITANYTYKLGKPIFCIPPADILNPRYSGVNKYIRDGAIVVFSKNDILYEYYGSYPSKVRNTNIVDIHHSKRVSDDPIFQEEITKRKKSSNKSVDSSNSTKHSTPTDTTNTTNDSKDAVPLEDSTSKDSINKDTSTYSDSRFDAIVQSLKKGYSYLDDISNDTNIDVSTLFEIMTELEIDGVVKVSFGNCYTLL